MTISPLELDSLATEAHPFRGRYPLWIGMALLVIGLVTTGLSLRAMLLKGGFVGLALLGLLIGLAGFLYLTRPYFAIAPNRLTTYNLMGSAVKRYPFASFSQLSIKNSSLYIESSYANEPRQKVNIRAWMVRKADWQRLKTALSKPL